MPLTAMPERTLADPALRECPGCGLFQRLPALSAGAVARCPRCDQVLRRHRINPMARALALGVSGLMLYAVAVSADFIDLDVYGRVRATSLIDGPVQLEQQGMWIVALVVLATIFVAPVARLGCLVWVLVGLRLRPPLPGLHHAFRWSVKLAPWSMVEVFLLGVLVAYTKLVDLAHVDLGVAVYALGALMLVQLAADAVLDPQAVWIELDAVRAHGPTGAPAPARAPVPRGPTLSCEVCMLVTDAVGQCPRCAARLEARKPASLTRSWALLAAAALLYIPANVLPVMTYLSLGRGQPNTILSGVVELAQSGMWPLALLVFFASITVPVLKLGGLSYLAWGAQRGARDNLRRRTMIYRVIESIGRWSMIDVFMITILTALVRMGQIASVFPGPGVVAFCAVVILTMFSAITFDPRVQWDEAGMNPGHAPTPRSRRAFTVGVGAR